MRDFKIFLLGVILAISACSPTEKVINPISESDKYFVSTDDSKSVLKVIELPGEKVIYEDYLAEVLNLQVLNPVEQIKDFGGNYYILVPGDFKIFVVRKSDQNLIATIDFSDDKSEPIDIAFANSTDAYIIHKNSIYVTLLDITNFVKAKQVTIGNPPHSIVVSGNQLIVSNQPDNYLSIIDSREKREVAKINTFPNPTFLSLSPDGKTAICISLGNGKLIPTQEKTPAVVSYLNILTRKIEISQELGFASISATDQIPKGLIVTAKDWGFVPTNENFLRVDTRTKDNINLITKRFFYFINYDFRNQKLLLLRDMSNRTDILFADDKSGEIGEFYTFPYKIKFVSVY